MGSATFLTPPSNGLESDLGQHCLLRTMLQLANVMHLFAATTFSDAFLLALQR